MSSPFPVITEYKVFGADEVIKTQREISDSFQRGELTVKEFNAALRENTREYQALNRAQSQTRMIMRVQNYELNQSLHIMSQIGNMGTKAVGIWQAYNVAQIRVEQSTRNVTDAQREVAKWQDIYNQYLRDFGADSAYTLDALDNLTDANNNLADAQDRAAKAQQDMYIGYVAMGVSAAGFVADVARITTAISGAGGLVAVLGTLEVAGIAAFNSIAAVLSSAAMLPLLPAAIANIFLPEEKKIMGWGISEETPPYEKPGYFPKEWWGWIPFAEDIAKAFGWTPETEMGGASGVGQFGIPRVPEFGSYILHPDEAVLRKDEAEEWRATRGKSGETRGTTLQARITQYNTINKMEDAEAAADRAYERLMERWGRKL